MYNQLLFKLEDEEREALEKSQKAWEEYSKKHAEFAASGYSGGTIYPLIYLTMLESLIIERTASLKSESDEIKRLRNL